MKKFILVFVLLSLILGGCTVADDKYASTLDFKEATLELKEMPNPSGKLVELGAGQYEVGEHIQEGRYKITPLSGTGSLQIDNEKLETDFRIFLGIDDLDYSEDSYTSNLVKGDIVQIDFFAKFTPVN